MIEALEIHRTLLTKWRHAMDLVGPGPLEPHFEDSLGAVSELNATGNWIDLGSGAGFPGIALAACWPKANVFLVESRHKRAVFLRQVISKAKLNNAHVLQCRSENIQDRFSGVISRAYKPPLEYLADAARLSSTSAKTILLLGDMTTLQLPPLWQKIEEIRYKVGTGYRKRWLLHKNT